MSSHLTECRFWLSSSDDDWHSLSSSSGLKLNFIGCIYYNIVAHEEPFVYMECIFTEVRTLNLAWLIFLSKTFTFLIDSGSPKIWFMKGIFG